MSKIKHAFENGKALIAFITCGAPDLKTTGAAVRAAAENGADLIELGIPFSDPTAEGPVLQEASLHALKNGITTDKLFAFVKELRRDVTVPMVFMTYANVVFSYGAKRFFSSCQESGIDGLILSDLPFEEKEEFLPFGQAYDVALISQIALSSKDRTAMIAKEAEGFLYMVSDPGMEGTKNGAQSELPSMVKMVRQNTDIPCAVGFETSTLEQIKEMAEFADGVIAASALVGLLGKYGTDAPRYIGEYVKEIKMALKTSFSR
ncbi:MAG: tryptophan synthase subunit alpha [Lachnospiraceae bacterium]|jgi:tryptophan synthase alpha chain|nr:tryptophan synthase subunit alpha [Lachnospiraceae bacterium]